MLHMALVFAVMHLYSFFFIASVHSVFFFYVKNLVLINRRKDPRYQSSLAVCSFLNESNTERTKSSNILCSMFVCIRFVLHKFVSGLNLYIS